MFYIEDKLVVELQFRQMEHDFAAKAEKLTQKQCVVSAINALNTIFQVRYQGVSVYTLDRVRRMRRTLILNFKSKHC